ncbi:MAG: MBL fold metallo-hydrolase [Mycobacterium sp.]|uniref:MBL fold metallo-hydrolase n=1 Tax=Mycobacterium sp. TaxID=1785 RepID=UPI00389AA508
MTANPSQLRLQVFVSPTHPIGNDGLTFSPTTSTLIYGEREAILVDAQFIKNDIDELGNVIEDLGKTLTTIFITHGHADYYFGIDTLAERFPGVRVVATAKVVADIVDRGSKDLGTFSAWFGDNLVVPTSIPEPLEDDGLVLEGHRLQVIDVDQADISPSSALYVPQLGAVIAGDLVYNEIHQMLALTGPAEWERWAASIDAIAALRPRTVVAGHKKPDATDDDGETILTGTKDYILDFARIAAAVASPDELIKAMQERYPDHGNFATLLVSAMAAKTGATLSDFADPANVKIT